MRTGRPASADGQVLLTIVCVSCRSRQDIRVPRRRGVKPGTYVWECFDCQGKEIGAAGAGNPRKRVPRGERGKQPKERTNDCGS